MKVLTAGAMFAYRAGDLERLETYAQESLSARTQSPATPSDTIWPLILLGIWANGVGDYRFSAELNEEASELALRTPERGGLYGIVTNNLGVNCRVRRESLRVR